mmetsp:Transcript_33726/g.61076  ORF Transcript_33726/g.61076 Transcript_33726/m.61076 type:complete len:612 (+) Transcript_33726:117-1952(+)
MYHALLLFAVVSAEIEDCKVSFIQGGVRISQLPEPPEPEWNLKADTAVPEAHGKPLLDGPQGAAAGLGLGLLPGRGSPVSGWMSYGHIFDGITGGRKSTGHSEGFNKVLTYASCILGVVFLLICAVLVKYMPKEPATFEDDCFETQSDDEAPRKSRLPPVLLWSVTFTSYFAESIVLPFLPLHFEGIGLTSIHSSVVFALLPMSFIFSSLAVSRACQYVGSSKILLFGAILQCASTFLFAYADQLTGGEGENAKLALMVYGLLRVIGGAGTACVSCASLGIAAKARPDDFSYIMGWNEVVGGCAFSLGPVLGDLLYASKGFAFPMMLAASLEVLALLLILALNCQTHDWETDPSDALRLENGESDMWTTLRRDCPWGVGLAVAANFAGCFYFYMMSANLESYLLYTVKTTDTQSSVVFGLYSFCFCASGPIFGYFADSWGPYRVCMVSFMMCGLAGSILFCPLIEKVPSEWMYIYAAMACSLLGTVMAGIHVPVLSAMSIGQEEESRTSTDTHVALFAMSLQLGACLGPILGTFLIEYTMFDFATMLVGSVMTVCGLAALPKAFSLPAFKKKKGKGKGYGRSPHIGHHADADPPPPLSSPIVRSSRSKHLS